MNERKSYPRDISREQFNVIRSELERFRRVTKPRKHDLYDIFCGILYVLKSGCPWSLLPHDYPPHHTVYTFFRQWGAKPFADQPSLLERLQHHLTDAEHGAQGRKKPTLLIVDAQSVKNADVAGTKGYDAGKKVSGIKRHIAVDTLGLPHAIAITSADVTDRTGGLLALSCRASHRCQKSIG